MTRLFHTTLFLIWAATILAQKSTYFIPKTSLHPDSIFTERLWPNVAIAENFQTAFPSFGQTPQEATQVQLTYDDRAIYVSAMCGGGGIRADGTERNATGQADYFTVAFDTWKDGQNAFEFGVTAAGQVFEQRYNDNQPNGNFLSPWSVEVRRYSDGWQAMFTIPFTALRYPNSGPVVWGLQLARFDRSSGERSTWSPESPLIAEKVWQFGRLEGMEHINAREKLRATVYGSTYASNYKYKSIQMFEQKGVSASLGTDFRVGIGTESTLQTTFLPEVSATRGTFSNNSFGYLLEYYPSLSQQRIFLADEIGLFPWYGTELQTKRYFPNMIGVNAGKSIGGRALNTTRFNTQTNSNWRLGAGLTLFMPLIEIEPLTGGENKGLIGAAIPTASLFTAQKIWRNNSSIRFSTANFLPGGNGGRSRNTLDFRLRNRTNQYEIWGFVRSNSNLAPMEGVPGTNLAHYWGAGKVNGAWQYGINASFWGSEYRAALDSNLLLSRIQRASAYVSNTIFPKKGPVQWFNWGVSTRVSYNYASLQGDQQFIYYNFNTHSIGRRFNELTFDFESDFKPAYRYFPNSGRDLKQRVGPLLQTAFSYSTDTRKRSVFTARTVANANWGNRFGQVIQRLAWRYQWSPMLQTRVLFQYEHNFNETSQVQTMPSGNKFTAFDRSQSQPGAGLTLFLNRRWVIEADLVIVDFTRMLQPEEFLLNSDGTTTATNTPQPKVRVVGNNTIVARASLYYAGPKGTQVRFVFEPARQNNYEAPDIEQSSTVRLEFLCHLFKR